MKRKILLLLTVLVLITIGITCRRSDLSISQNSDANKILAFLESQKLKDNNASNRNANIDLLKENLDFNFTRTEKAADGPDFLLIPIKDAVIKIKNLERISTLTLLLLVDKQGKINSGSIVYFIPADGKKHSSLPENVFKNMFSQKTVPIDGIFKMLSLTGRWLSQIEIKHGKIFSTGSIQRNDRLQNGARGSMCIDWYLVTTYHWEDGHTSQTEEYVGTTCDCDDPIYQSLCSDGGGGGSGSGGGGGNSSPEYTEEEGLTYDSPPDPSYSPSYVGSTDYINPVWHAVVSYWYDPNTHTFYDVNGNTPYAVPISQPFTDSNGNPATLVCSSLPGWQFYWVPLTTNSMYVSWTFIGLYTYSYTTGIVPLTFNLGISKVCWKY